MLGMPSSTLGAKIGSLKVDKLTVSSAVKRSLNLEAISQIAGIGLNTLGAIWRGQHWATSRELFRFPRTTRDLGGPKTHVNLCRSASVG